MKEVEEKGEKKKRRKKKTKAKKGLTLKKNVRMGLRVICLLIFFLFSFFFRCTLFFFLFTLNSHYFQL